MSKTKKIVLKEKKQEVALRSPEFLAEVKTVEDMGNAIYAASQEFLLVIEDALIRHHGFTDADLKRLHEEIVPVLKGVAEYEKHGLSLLSPNDIGIVAEIAETRYLKERAGRAGLHMPIMEGAKPFLKKLKEKNDQAI